MLLYYGGPGRMVVPDEGTDMSLLMYVLSVFLHIVAAVVWVGGILFLVVVIVPAVRKPPLQESRALLFEVVGTAFRPIGWICLVVLVGTGLTNLHFRGVLNSVHDPAFWGSPFGQVLGVKVIAVSLLILLSMVHDFWIGPESSRASREAPGAESTLRLRRIASRMGRVSALLALLVILLGVMLVRGRPW